MATVTLGNLTIPDAAVPRALVFVEAYLTERGISFAAMTTAEKVRRVMTILFTSAWRESENARARSLTEVQTVINQAIADTSGVVG